MWRKATYYRSASIAVLVAGLLWAVSQCASAASLSITSEVFTGNAPLASTPTPASDSGSFSQSVTGNSPAAVSPPNWLLPGGPPRVQLSPYAFNSGSGPDGSAALDAPYSVLDSGGGPVSTATYDVNSSSFSFLWGSPDPYNEIAFFSGPDGTGSPEGAFNGTSLACSSSTCKDTDFDLVTFTASGGAIGSAVLTNTGAGAFEYDIDPVSAVPLPASIYMFGSVLTGAFWLSHRKRSTVSSLGGT